MVTATITRALSCERSHWQQWEVANNKLIKEVAAMMNKVVSAKIKVLSGSFLKGCGVTVYHRESDSIYHLIVLEDKGSGRLFVEIENKQYFAEDIESK